MMIRESFPKDNPSSKFYPNIMEPTITHGVYTDECLNLEMLITQLLQAMRIPAHINGYRYLRKAIFYAVKRDDPGSISAKTLFAKVSRDFGTTPGNIDRGIRYALIIAWKQCDFVALQKTYSFMTSFAYDRPTNLKLIACIADHYILKFKNENP